MSVGSADSNPREESGENGEMLRVFVTVFKLLKMKMHKLEMICMVNYLEW